MNAPRELPFAPAAERNRGPILEALTPRLPGAARVLEIGSGTGQHAVAFTSALSGVRWWPTERRGELPGLVARVAAEGGPNLCEPVELDVLRGPWPDGPFEAVFTANTAHIMHWPGVCAMLAGAGRVLAPGGKLFIYGPFRRGGRHTAASNARFDQSLRRADPGRGVRDLEALESEAEQHQLSLHEIIEMPANNLIAVFLRHD